LRVGLTDRQGAFLPMRMSEEAKLKIDGKDVTLTIDSELQEAATLAIKKAVEEHGADNGAIVVQAPGTGDILAMANYPSFDPNSAGGGEFGYNAAYMAQLEPGSTFKIMTLAKAIDEGVVGMSDHLYCAGQFKPTRSSTVHCDAHHGVRAHGSLDGIGAIAKSCNVAAGTWALKIGRDDMIKYVEDLGLLEKSNIGVPGEQKGLFRRDE